MMNNLKYSKSISVIIPIFNDYDVLDELNIRLTSVLQVICNEYEIVLIDDGSIDKSWEKIKELKTNNDHITGIRLMRNFGQHNAISAGLDYVSGDVVILMDSDLQDKPEDIPALIETLLMSNASMCIAKRKSRKDSYFKKLVSRLFYFVTTRITEIKHQPNLGVFRAIRKELVAELLKHTEITTNSLSLMYWIGVDYVTFQVDRDGRFSGKSGYSLKKMISLSLDRIFSFLCSL